MFGDMGQQLTLWHPCSPPPMSQSSSSIQDMYSVNEENSPSQYWHSSGAL